MLYHSIFGFDVVCNSIDDMLKLSRNEHNGSVIVHEDKLAEIQKSIDAIYQELKSNKMNEEQFNAVLSALPDYKLQDGTTLPHLAKTLYLLFKQ